MIQHLKERRTPTSRVDLGIVDTSWSSQMLTNTPSEHLRTRRQKASVCRRGGYTFDYLGCARPPLFRAQSLALTISQRSPRQISSPVDLERLFQLWQLRRWWICTDSTTTQYEFLYRVSIRNKPTNYSAVRVGPGELKRSSS